MARTKKTTRQWQDHPATSQLRDHQVNGLNELVTIQIVDKPGPGGARHHYKLQLRRPGLTPGSPGPLVKECHIEFQNGAILERGPNGWTQEALLAIVAHRLMCFQTGPFACKENADALQHVQAAMETLQSRTQRRVAAGTEGTHKGN